MGQHHRIDVGEHERDHALVGQLETERRERAAVTGIGDRDPTRTALARERCSLVRRPTHDQMSQAVAAIDDAYGVAPPRERNVRTRDNAALLQASYIVWKACDSMRISAAEIGIDQMPRDIFCIGRWHMTRTQYSLP